MLLQNLALKGNKLAALNDLVCVSIMAARSPMIALITLILAAGSAQKLPEKTELLYHACP